MKVTELMIGDWVSYNGHPVLVEALNKSNGYAIEKDMISIKLTDDTCLGINAERLEPLPLTVEILEKNGFVNVEEHRKHYTGNFDLSKYTHVMSWCENYFVAIAKVRDNCWNCHIQGNCANLDGGIGSVHHLQHALRTCEIGKIIVV